MENQIVSPPHVDASRPSLGFPLGTALLLIVIFSLSGIFSCWYHWDKLRSLRRSYADGTQTEPDIEASPSKPKPEYSSQKTHEAKSLKRLKKRNGDKDLPFSEASMCHKPEEMGENVNNETNERNIHEENIKPCSKDIEIPEATQNDDKENALAVEEIDNKENAAAFDENIKLDFVTRELVKKDAYGENQHCSSRRHYHLSKMYSISFTWESNGII